ncbi:hypothetical protein PFISCL1PPCAC_22252 [Pristionchus fissidentatus]|uniref:Uncharacterized protein n=1 Tax=Pristionchus fissidentatus TaxID=1538716 RepID=A0AAV5WK75_9BILA|nr:hypothetical protein PFISCL1PPCAC_22252 [Pristionchus fissidentatus]
MLLRLLLLAGLASKVSSQASDLVEEVRTCVREHDFGNSTLVCDPHGRLANTTVDKLEALLGGLSNKIACACPDGCRRADGSTGYVGLIHVSNSFATQNLSSDMASIFRERGMGNATCNHGLLLAYMKDTQKLASYRGGRSFVQLTDEDMIKLHEIAKKGNGGDDAMALQFLLNNYKDIVESPVTRAESWTPVIGLIAAILLVLIALAILMALFLARFCCCCAKRNNKEVYHVTPVPTYKHVEPIYVVTPTGERHYGGSDALYSTPYSGSPMPLGFPPPPGASRPITPGSNKNTRMRVRPTGAMSMSNASDSPPNGKTKSTSSKRPTDGRSSIEEDPDYAAVLAGHHDYGTMRDVGEMYSSLPRGMPPPPLMMMPPPNGSMMGSLPRGAHMPFPPPHMMMHPGMMIPPPLSPRSEASGSLRTASLPPHHGSSGDLPFLDPKRKMETQTREEMIY